MTKSRGILPARRPWTAVELDLVRELYPTFPTVALARTLNRTKCSVHAAAREIGVKKDPAFIAEEARKNTSLPSHGSRAHRFQPGQVPPNKGLRRPGWAPGEMAKTQFKPGVKPWSYAPIGSHRELDGYLQRKVTDTGYPPRDWRPVHRLVWEAAHGPVPDGHVVAFLPGRKTTDPELITVDALECVSRAEMARRNSIHNLPPELAEVCRLRGRLAKAINERAKDEE